VGAAYALRHRIGLQGTNAQRRRRQQVEEASQQTPAAKTRFRRQSAQDIRLRAQADTQAAQIDRRP